jgi:UDP-N-acetyl-D-mannosaminuronic acid dehydrogenase
MCQVIIIAVGTPLKENLLPDMSLILDVTTKVAKNAADESIIILRSTIVPGITENLITPQIKKINETLNIAICPERIVEGKAMEEVEVLPEIIGVQDNRTGEIVKELFSVLGSKQVEITSTKTAEAAKIFANVYRYVNFALANEFALISENLKIDSTEAIKLANKGYPRSNIPLPGPAAGPCLRKDGLFLSNKSSVNLIKVAWLLNESIPLHIIETIEEKYGSVYERKVGVLGKAYKADVDDTRDSPALKIIEELEAKGAAVFSYDPYTQNSSKLEEALECEIVILAVNHSVFNTLTVEMLSHSKVVYDVWGQLCGLDLLSRGIIYLSLGKGNNVFAKS